MDTMIDGNLAGGHHRLRPYPGLAHRYAALAGLRHCKVLVLSGDADRLTPFRHAEAIAAELPEAELIRPTARATW